MMRVFVSSSGESKSELLNITMKKQLSLYGIPTKTIATHTYHLEMLHVVRIL